MFGVVARSSSAHAFKFVHLSCAGQADQLKTAPCSQNCVYSASRTAGDGKLAAHPALDTQPTENRTLNERTRAPFEPTNGGTKQQTHGSKHPEAQKKLTANNLPEPEAPQRVPRAQPPSKEWIMTILRLKNDGHTNPHCFNLTS